MSRSKRDILDTEAMLTRLTNLLVEHETAPAEGIVVGYDFGKPRRDAEELRRISMTLHRWFELECGDGNEYGSWAIVRGHKTRTEGGLSHGERFTFTHDDDGKPFIERHHYQHGKGKDYVTYTSIADREGGARRRLARIMARYPSLQAYVQTDPRGCALYILTPKQMNGVLPQEIDAIYSRGIAVFQ